MHQSLSFIACRLNTFQHVSGILMAIIRSLSTAVAALFLKRFIAQKIQRDTQDYKIVPLTLRLLMSYIYIYIYIWSTYS